MKHYILKNVSNIVMIAVSIILSWGGIIYATNDPKHFRLIGILVSFIGYAIFFWAVIRYEMDAEDEPDFIQSEKQEADE